MSVRRRAFAGVGAALCLLAAAVLVLVALDARAWQRRITRDDLSFRAQHAHTGLWRSPAVLPGDPARALLGLAEPLAYRRALQGYWLSTVSLDLVLGRDHAPERFATQAALQGLLASGRSPVERSTAANLLGVLTVTTPASDTATQQQTLDRAAGYFQQAIQDDPTNYAAKLNLELVLRLSKPDKSSLDKKAQRHFGLGKGKAPGSVGSGF
jgi:hypothetical protein